MIALLSGVQSKCEMPSFAFASLRASPPSAGQQPKVVLMLIFLRLVFRRRLGHIRSGGEKGDVAAVRRPASGVIALVAEGDLP